MATWLEWFGMALIPAFLAVDFVRRPSAEPDSAPSFRRRALSVTTVAFATAYGIGLLWGAKLGSFHLLPGDQLGSFAGAIVGVLIYELVHYAYHRAAHRWDWLWRLGHQMHHSTETLDSFGAYYMHPIDAALFTTWSVLVFYPLLGLDPLAAASASAFLTFNSMFQHSTFRTPQWLGYLIQRPESHSVHHARGVHAYNYSDLPLWDIVFGTFRNPEKREAELGFYPGASARVGEMLLGRDVSAKADAASEQLGSPAPRPT